MPKSLYQKMKSALESFLKEQVFNLDKLENKLHAFNPFKVLGVVHMEIRHSYFLSWIIDPNESHGLGNYFLKRVINSLNIIHADLRVQLNLSDLKDVKILREKDDMSG